MTQGLDVKSLHDDDLIDVLGELGKAHNEVEQAFLRVQKLADSMESGEIQLARDLHGTVLALLRQAEEYGELELVDQAFDQLQGVRDNRERPAIEAFEAEQAEREREQAFQEWAKLHAGENWREREDELRARWAELQDDPFVGGEAK